MVPQWLPDFSRGSHTRLDALDEVDGADVGPGAAEWPGAGLILSPHLSLFCTGKCPLSMHCFLFFFLGTGDGEQCQEELSAGGALRANADVLDAESEQLGSEMGLKVASIRITFSPGVPVLLCVGNEVLTNLTLAFM